MTVILRRHFGSIVDHRFDSFSGETRVRRLQLDETVVVQLDLVEDFVVLHQSLQRGAVAV